MLKRDSLSNTAPLPENIEKCGKIIYYCELRPYNLSCDIITAIILRYGDFSVGKLNQFRLDEGLEP